MQLTEPPAVVPFVIVTMADGGTVVAVVVPAVIVAVVKVRGPVVNTGEIWKKEFNHTIMKAGLPSNQINHEYNIDIFISVYFL